MLKSLRCLSSCSCWNLYLGRGKLPNLKGVLQSYHLAHELLLELLALRRQSRQVLVHGCLELLTETVGPGRGDVRVLSLLALEGLREELWHDAFELHLLRVLDVRLAERLLYVRGHDGGREGLGLKRLRPIGVLIPVHGYHQLIFWPGLLLYHCFDALNSGLCDCTLNLLVLSALFVPL